MDAMPVINARQQKATVSSLSLREALAEIPGPLTILATGPLTNIAEVAASDRADLLDVVEAPQALIDVLASGLPLTLVPLDITNTVPIDGHLLYRFGSLAQRPLALAAGSFFALYGHAANEVGWYAWDTLTTACLIEETLCQITQGKISVDPQTGQTQRVPEGTKVGIVDGVSPSAFLLETLSRETIEATFLNEGIVSLDRCCRRCPRPF